MPLAQHSGVSASKRSQWLLEQLNNAGAVNTVDAALHWGCSRETIRKDLVALEAQGLIRRAHGGALPAGSLTPEAPLESRTSHLEEKLRIAQVALEYLEEGATVFLESGTTTGLIASLIPPDFRLTVVTNSLPIAHTLMSSPGVTCHFVGGKIRRVTQASAGYWALRELDDLAVDIAVLGTNAISESGELSTPDTDEAAMKARAVNLGYRRILLADHSKFGMKALHRYGTLSDISVLITGKEATDAVESITGHHTQEMRFA